MNERLGALSWSIPLGRLFLTHIRVSPTILLLAAILVYRLDWSVGLTLFGILLASILAHEFGHVFAARLTGGMADEILIWPLGGLAFVQPGRHPRAALLTIAAGPAVNLALALLFFPGFYASRELWSVLNPFVVPVAELTAESWQTECLLLAFFANWLLLLVNLVPIWPLDGGQLLQAVLSERLPAEGVHRVLVTVGVTVSIGVMVGGLMFDQAWIVAAGGVMLVLNVLLSSSVNPSERYDDSFMGYDFSQGYTSLERSGQTPPREPRPNWLQAWRARRRERQQAREAARRLDLERQLDALLAKVHEQGMDALSLQEQRLLRRASEELRHRTRPQDT